MEFNMTEIKDKKDLAKIRRIFKHLTTICESHGSDSNYFGTLENTTVTTWINDIEKYVAILYKVNSKYKPKVTVSDSVYEYLKEQNKACYTKEVIAGLTIRGIQNSSKSVRFDNTVATALLRHPNIDRVGRGLWQIKKTTEEE